MKFKFLTVLAIAGMAIVGCGSDKNADGTTDSNTVDTSMSTPSTDTSMPDSTTMPDTTTSKPVDSTRQ